MINHGQGAAPSSALDELLDILKQPDSAEKFELLLQIVPDDYSAWHKFILLDSPSFIRTTQLALQVNPKSYSTWYHRFLKTMSQDETEDRLTRLLLKYDPRNFHCWNYRRLLKLPPIHEYLNYSALHDLIKKGFNIDFKSIIFTDPFYEGGYIHFLSNVNKLRIAEDFLIVSMEKPIRRVWIDDEKIFEAKEKRLVFKTKRKMALNQKIKVECEDRFFEGTYAITNSDAKLMDDLIRLEPKCKWPYLVKLKGIKNEKERLEIIEKLVDIDPVRRNYYQNLKHFDVVELK